MAAWGSFGRNASETAAKAVHQVKIKSEVTRINTLIADEQKKIEEACFMMGQQYAALHHDDYEPEFAEQMAMFLEAKKNIEQYQIQIKNIKGVVVCTECNAEIPKGAAFCNSCGAPVPRKQENSGPVCSGCGAPLGENVRFCTSCGTPVVKPEPVEPVVVEAAPVCPNCGAELDSDSVFCAECGVKVK